MNLLPEGAGRYKHPVALLIVSSCPEPWGGSEELWAQSALLLAQAGHRIQIAKTTVDWHHPRIQALLAVGCTVTDLHQVLPWPIRLRNRVLPNRWRYARHRGEQVLQRVLAAHRPDLTIVAQGNNYDGTTYALRCRRAGYPYVLVAQKAVHFFFPQDSERQQVQQAYRSAQHCFFVSTHNLNLTRQQLSLPLTNATVVANPVHASLHRQAPLPMPQTENKCYKLACVARLDVLDKGQDLLLDVLAKPKWRSRPLRVTFFGSGPHRVALQELVRFLALDEQVDFGGQVAGPVPIWQTHHALILPSRSEGLPLALVEAMLCGRPAIATEAGGIAEFVTDNETGFLAKSPSVEAIDEALERAWNRRADWPRIGLAAAHHAQATNPHEAAAHFCELLLQLPD